MSWESTEDTLAKKTLGAQAREMEEGKLQYIILRWKTVLKTSQNLYGFYGAKTWTGERLDGGIDVSASIDPNKVCCFFPDEFRVGYAIIPRCDRNLDILAATINEVGLPFAILDDDIRKEVQLRAEKLPKEKPAKAKKGEVTLEELAAAS